jgi:hypothetical protein
MRRHERTEENPSTGGIFQALLLQTPRQYWRIVFWCCCVAAAMRSAKCGMPNATAIALTPLDALARSPLVVWLKTNAPAYPLLEWVHLVAIATVFGTILMVDLPILGLLRALDAILLARTTLPWTMGAFTLAALSGIDVCCPCE